jgi:hypothetical protein
LAFLLILLFGFIRFYNPWHGLYPIWTHRIIRARMVTIPGCH